MRAYGPILYESRQVHLLNPEFVNNSMKWAPAFIQSRVLLTLDWVFFLCCNGPVFSDDVKENVVEDSLKVEIRHDFKRGVRAGYPTCSLLLDEYASCCTD